MALTFNEPVIWGDTGSMLRTITLGSCVSVQGTFIRTLDDGKIMVRVDEKTYIGFPVKARAA